MGSGGLRGLQILRSGVQSVRGGFDSHAFPPFLALLFAIGLAAPGLAAADAGEPGVPPDSARAPGIEARADSAAAPAQQPAVARPAGRSDTTGSAPAVVPAPRTRGRLLDQPRFVMLRSALVPGWGQFHNRAWIKALLVAGSEGAMIAGLVSDNRALRDLDAALAAARASGDLDAENLAVERYNARLDRFVRRQWLLGGLLVYALTDAYVDAHFVHFKIQFENDPALPEGVRLGMEMRF